MNKKAKLIWEFSGQDAEPMAQHHAKHLKEFAEREQIVHFGSGITASENHAEAYLIVGEKDMIAVRDALRPKRGEWVED